MIRSRVRHEVRVASSRGASEGRSTWWIATSPKLIFNDQAEEDKESRQWWQPRGWSVLVKSDITTTCMMTHVWCQSRPFAHVGIAHRPPAALCLPLPAAILLSPHDKVSVWLLRKQCKKKNSFFYFFLKKVHPSVWFAWKQSWCILVQSLVTLDGV